jgi:hypothetical protein
MITFTIDGTVTELQSGAPLPDLFVKAFDKDCSSTICSVRTSPTRVAAFAW